MDTHTHTHTCMHIHTYTHAHTLSLSLGHQMPRSTSLKAASLKCVHTAFFWPMCVCVFVCVCVMAVDSVA